MFTTPTIEVPLVTEAPGGISGHSILPETWFAGVETIRTDVSYITRHTEDSFLRIGERLRNYQSETSDLIGLAGEVVDLISGGDLAMRIEGLSGSFSDLLDTFEADARDGGVDSFQNALELLERMQWNSYDLNKVVKFLRMLGVAASVESAQLGGDEIGVRALADNIDKLTSSIQEKNKTILKRVASLVELVEESIDRSRRLVRRSRANLDEIIEGMRRSLDVFHERRLDCGRAAERVSGAYEEVHGDVREIVTDIQYHDITRQQFQHVAEALAIISMDARDFVESYERVSDAKALYVAKEGCRLQAAQTRNASAKFVEAVEDIVARLDSVSRSVARLTEETHEIAFSGDAGDVSFLDRIGDGLQVVERAVEESRSIRDELRISTTVVGETVAELVSFAEEIQEVSEEIELIALNASVRAAHIGKLGAAVGVIADTLQDLSISTQGLIENASRILGEIEEVSKDILESGERADEHGGRAETVAKDIEETLVKLRETNERVTDSMTKSYEISRKMNDDIRSSLVAISEHRRIRNDGAGFAQRLETLAREAESKIPAIDEQYDTESLREFAERYTMESERDVHRLVSGDEAFDATDDDEPREEGEFGENVELF